MASNSDLISAVPIFSQLPKKALARFAASAIERKFVEGTNIVTEGEPGVAVYIIAEGTVAVTHPGEAEPRATLHEGSAFGEMSMLDGAPRTATIKALTPVTCLALPRWDFVAEIRANGDFALELLEQMSRRVRDLEALVAKLETAAKV